MVTMGKEAHDDWKRHQRDLEANSTRYLILDPSTAGMRGSIPATRSIPSSKLKIGDLVLLEKNQRVPADLVLLRTSDSTGTCFVRTDQLDGETDWKLRMAVPSTQQLNDDRDLLDLDAEIYGTFLYATAPCHKFNVVDTIADPPIKDIHTFIGTFSIHTAPSVLGESPKDVPLQPKVEPLTAENVLWSNTVLAAGSAVGFVIYAGSETRAVMNTSHPETKVGLLDLEINRLSKVRVFV